MSNCIIPECHRPARTHKMCNAHYARFRRSGSTAGLYALRDSTPRICTIAECDKPHLSRGLCAMHYERMRKNGKLTAKYKRPAGDGTIKDGYVVFVRHLEGRKLRLRRCRVVMEKILGRPLLPEETVHHKNGDKQDDRPSNLELWCSVHPKGQRISDLIKHALHILKTYGDTKDAQTAMLEISKCYAGQGEPCGCQITIQAL